MENKKLFSKEEKNSFLLLFIIWNIGFLSIVIGFALSFFYGYTNGILVGGFLLVCFVLLFQIIIKTMHVMITLKLFQLNNRSKK